MTQREAHCWLKEKQRMMTQYRHLFSSEDIEANGMAILAIEKQEKYKWHDLRKNPEDLPAVEERVVLTLDLMREHRNVYGHRAKNGAWVVNGFETRLDVIAWRTDEPFEEDNK